VQHVGNKPENVHFISYNNFNGRLVSGDTLERLSEQADAVPPFQSIRRIHGYQTLRTHALLLISQGQVTDFLRRPHNKLFGLRR